MRSCAAAKSRCVPLSNNPSTDPLPEGRGQTECAAIITAIEACTQTKCQAITSKPNPVMLKVALSGPEVTPSRCIMVGDRLYTDIKTVKKAGMYSAMSLTGDSTLEEAIALPKAQQPEFLLDRINRLAPASVLETNGWSENVTK